MDSSIVRILVWAHTVGLIGRSVSWTVLWFVATTVFAARRTFIHWALIRVFIIHCRARGCTGLSRAGLRVLAQPFLMGVVGIVHGITRISIVQGKRARLPGVPVICHNAPSHSGYRLLYLPAQCRAPLARRP
jgi:hypothetical protein